MDAEILLESEDASMKIMDSNIAESTDVLMEILMLLPPKSIFRFMSVSKRWTRIIMDPIFIQTYSARLRRCSAAGGGRLLAFFQRTTMHFGKYPRPSDEHPMNILPITNHRNIIKYVPRRFGYFINSSNGLILCSRDPTVARLGTVIFSNGPIPGPHDRRPIYHVVNPVTGKSVSLPPPPNRYYRTSTGIMCEENTTELVANYIIVRAELPRDPVHGNIQYIETYSSRTGEWAESILVATGNFCLLRLPPVVANGVFHWYLTVCGIAVYDPKDGKNHLQLIHMPYGYFDSNMAVTRSVDDLLWFGLMSNGRMRILKLPKGESGSYRRKTTIGHEEWVLMYDFDDSRCISMRLEALIPWNFLVAVVRKGEKVFLYDFERETIERVRYDGTYYEYHDNNLCPYLEPSFLSSYAL